jgi:TatD DNase family protein
MDWIDSHAHIYSAEFETDRQESIERSKNNSVRRILMPAIDSSTHHQMLALGEQYPETCMSMMGLHPCSVKENAGEELKIIEDYLQTRTFIGVGEIGLDFYWDLSFKEQQYAAFHRQLELALHYDLPVSIHSRESTAEAIEVVRSHQKGALKGVFHCFSGDLNQAREVVDLGFYLGIGGVLTFKNAGLDKIVEQIDTAHLILETDAPYLAPVPYRGKRNECAYIPLIGQKLADCKQVTLEEIARITTANTEKLFALKG